MTRPQQNLAPMREGLLHTPLNVIAGLSALNARDADAFTAAFHPDGSIDDWGHHAKAADAIRHWAASAIGTGPALLVDPIMIRTQAHITCMHLRWTSSNGTGDTYAYARTHDGLTAALVLGSRTHIRDLTGIDPHPGA